MGLKMFPRQIHVVFNSAEDRRITEPILNHSPNKVYYFTASIKSTGQKDEHMDFFIKNKELFKNKLPNLQIIHQEIDYTEYIDIIQELSKIIKNEREEDPRCQIYFNVGSGSKMTALAAAEASKLWDCETYYMYSSHYDPKALPRHSGEMFIKRPLVFPIKKPKKVFIKVLKIINNMIEKKYKNKDFEEDYKFIYKKDLLDTLIEKDVIKLNRKNEDYRKERSSYYAKLNKRYLDPISKDLIYIKISDDKRNKKIYLTPIGEEILNIFKYLI